MTFYSSFDVLISRFNYSIHPVGASILLFDDSKRIPPAVC